MPPPLMLQAQVKQGQVQELAPAPEVNKPWDLLPVLLIQSGIRDRVTPGSGIRDG